MTNTVDAGEVQTRFTGDAGDLKRTIQASMGDLDKFAAQSKKIGKKLTLGLTLPIIGFAAAATKSALTADKSFTKIRTLVGRSAAEVDNYRKTAKQMSAETAVAYKDLADGLFTLTSAGLSAVKAQNALRAAARASAIGMGDVQAIALGVTRSMSAYASEGLTAAAATDMLVRAMEQGNIADAAGLVQGMSMVTSLAAELDIGLDDVLGTLAALSREMDVSRASEGLRGILSKLIKPAQMAEKELARVGLTIEEVRAAFDKDLVGGLRMLEASGANLGKVFEDVQALSAALALLGADASEVDKVMAALDDSTGTVDARMKDLEESASFKVSQEWNKLQLLLTELGEDHLPLVVDAFEKMGNFVDWAGQAWSGLGDDGQRIALGLAAVAAVAGPAAWVLGSVVGAVIGTEVSHGSGRSP